MTNAGRGVAVILSNRFQELEFWYPVLRFREEGIEVSVVGSEGEEAHVSELGYPVVPNLPVSGASPGDYDAIVIPGAAPQTFAKESPLAAFLGRANGSAPILAASGNGILALAAAGLVDSKRIAAPQNCAEQVAGAGGNLENAGVCVDGQIVTCRSPDDLPDYFASLLKLLGSDR